MARKLAYIAEVGSVEPIEGADRLEQVMLKGHGWKVVTSKGDFSVGDLACFFEIDSFLPADDERYAFLKERCLKRFVSKSGNVLREGIRIKSIKLRGVLSQGLLMPLGLFPEVEHIVNERYSKGTDFPVFRKFHAPNSIETHSSHVPSFEGSDVILGIEPLRIIYDKAQPEFVSLVGEDLTELLHVEHIDEVKEQLQPQMGNAMSADAMGSFPTAWIPKSDEIRLQNLTDWFDTMKGRKWEISVKADGCSCTIAYSPTIDFDNPNIVCSRNLRLKRETAAGTIPVYWQVAEKFNILGKLSELLLAGKEYAVQGEIVGPGIQSDRNKEQEYVFKCFRIWDIKNRRFINPNETVAICKELDIPHVEVLETDFPFFDKITTMEDALKYAEGKTAEGNEREGVVLKTCDDGPYRSCKIISNKYLMKQED